MASNLAAAMEPMHEKRRHFEEHPEIITEIMMEGSRKARQVALETMQQVRGAVKITY
jgi:tryptophanyl-tRNA synthetase